MSLSNSADERMPPMNAVFGALTSSVVDVHQYLVYFPY